jgi:hypothetical protein
VVPRTADATGLPPRLVPLLTRQLALTAVRLSLGASALAGAFLAGVERAPGVAGFAFGAGTTTFMLLSDRRSLLLDWPTPEPIPSDAEHERWHRYVAAGLFPSTIGVGMLAIVSLGFDPVLSAVLAGVLAGMGAAGAVGSLQIFASERRDGLRLFAEGRKGNRLFVEQR